jgi:uncharacterized protein (TIGR04255 family)
MPFALPDVELGHLTKSPLQVAVIQLRFRPILAIDAADRVAPFQEHLAGLNPALELYEQGELRQIAFQIGPAGVQQSAAPRETVWKFATSSNSLRLDLTRTQLSLEATSYDDFDSFEATFEQAFAGFEPTFGLPRVTRIGVRYVNHVPDERLDGDTLAEVISPELLGPIGSSKLGCDVLGSTTALRFQEPEFAVTIQHGLVEPGQYLLDFDCYAEPADGFDIGSIGASIRSFHQTIEKLFCWSVTPSFLEELK